MVRCAECHRKVKEENIKLYKGKLYGPNCYKRIIIKALEYERRLKNGRLSE